MDHGACAMFGLYLIDRRNDWRAKDLRRYLPYRNRKSGGSELDVTHRKQS